MVGGIIMTHGDDTGLTLPPRMAPIQVICLCPLFNVFFFSKHEAQLQNLAFSFWKSETTFIATLDKVAHGT